MAKEPKIIEFDSCPNCGSKERLAGKLAEEAKKKGQMRKDLNFYANIRMGVVKDPQMEHKLLIGSSVPAYGIFWDVCLQCGTMYAVKVEIGEAVKGLKPPPQQKLPPDIPFTGG